MVARALAMSARRLVVDAAPEADPGAVARRLADLLRVAGRHVLVVDVATFWRPASVRLERGRQDADAYYEDRLDVSALRRELLLPLRQPGSARVLPSLWDPTTDRATREPYVTLPAGGVAIVFGDLLLDPALPWDLAVHLALSPSALRRRVPDRDAWRLAAYRRYEAEQRPEETADVVVRVDHAEHPALVEFAAPL